ncbi:MAG: RDD family protein [Rickettsiales bacterium]|nr:RDD family protein [Pseudomonadota bacterium]MDA0966741.1 RDD family protein [Pseudomonadota bacterium]MDG4543413.1 RDD family protein [Rickettsiales bacterium]MDG4546193.1 RDD family protein [Rickettsiales bacterium]MDG4547666.1 RDD family protein [Rickettsiales bacterium]
MDTVSNKVEYAGFWIRVGAYLLDLLIFMIPLSVLNYIMIIIFSAVTGLELGSYEAENYHAHITQKDAMMHSALQIINCIIMVFVCKMFLTSKWQATPGKRFMNIYVVGISGEKISPKTAILRTALPLFVSVLFILSMNFRTAGIEKNLPTPDNNFVEDIKDIMPSTYDYFTQSNLDELGVWRNLVFVVNLSPDIISGKVEIKDAVANLKFYEGVYSEEDIAIIEIMLEEYIKLSHEDRAAIQQHVGTIGAETIADILKILVVSLLFFIVFFIWYIMAAFTKEKTAFHDIVAKTRVIKGRP